jgi:hypothetical protein
MFRRNLVCFGNALKQEPDLAKVGVEGSNPFARSNAFKGLAPQMTCGAKPLLADSYDTEWQEFSKPPRHKSGTKRHKNSR